MYLLKSFQLFITCFIGCTIIIFYVFEINNKHINQLIKINNNKFNKNNNTSSKIKTIIAYSLQKQIEIETKDMVDCHNNIQLTYVQMTIDRWLMAQQKSNNTNQYRKGDVGEEEDDDDEDDNTENNNWIHVTASKLYFYSAFYDDRLHQYPYVRIVGMIQGKFFSSEYFLLHSICKVSQAFAKL